MHPHAISPYLEVRISCTDPAEQEVMIALLEPYGYEAFEQQEDCMLAFIQPEQYQAEVMQRLCKERGLLFDTKTIAPENWNEAWEASFEPVAIGQFCLVRAHFHPAQQGFQHQLVITPRMSFGTGHHATTRLMIGAMQHLDFKGKKVLDYGCGTGILGILAEQLGAAAVLGLEIDPGAADNARDNVEENGCVKMDVATGGLELAEDAFDMILANINLNVLLESMSELKQKLKPARSLLMSGIRPADLPQLLEAAAGKGFSLCTSSAEGDWTAVLMQG